MLIRRCAQLEATTPHDVTSAALYTLRLLARRIPERTEQIRDLVHRITDMITTHYPTLLTHRGIGPHNAAAPPITAATTPTDHTARPLLPPCAVSAPGKHPRAKPPVAGSSAAATAKPMPRFIASPYPDCAGTSVPATTSPVALSKAKPIAKPFAA